jgi:serine phosphatase RsbU (regulator of sigma subunit)/streptogramin lyase
MIFRLPILTLLAVFTLCSEGIGQLNSNYKFDHLISENGFPAENVYSLIQDNKSNFWALTERGLMRYNGHNGKFYASKADGTGLLKSRPYKLYIDGTGLIWISYVDTCVSSFNPVTEKFEHYISNPADAGSFPASMAANIFEDSQGRLWIPTWGGGLCLFNRNDKTFKKYTHREGDSTSISTNIVTSIEEDTDGSFIIGSWEGLTYNYIQKFNPKTEKFERVDWSEYKVLEPLIWDEVNYFLRIVQFIRRDPKNNLLIGTYVGLFYVDRTNKTIARLTPGSTYAATNPGKNFVENMTKCVFTPNGKAWISSEIAGIMVVDLNDLTYDVLMRDQNANAVGLSSNVVRDMHVDDEGTVYLATGGGGIDIYNPYQNQFRLISNESLHAGRFHTQTNYFILELNTAINDSVILVGSGNGVSVIDRFGNWQSQITLNKDFRKQLDKYPWLRSVNADHAQVVKGIWCFPDVWLFSTWGGLIRYNPATRQVDYRYIGLYNDVRFAVQEANFGYFLATQLLSDIYTLTPKSQEAVFRYDYATDEITFVARVDNESCGRFVSPIFRSEGFVRVDSVHFFLERSPRCFQVFNQSTNKFTTYSYYPPYQNFPDSVVTVLTSNEQGEVWLKAENGFYRMNLLTNEVTNCTDYLHLKPNEEVASAIMDKNGILWIGLKRDLIQFNPETKESYRFTKNHGLDIGGHADRFWPRQMGNTMYIPVSYGLLSFDPDKIHLDTSSFVVDISSIAVNRDTFSVAEVDAFLSVTPGLDWNENFLSFEFYSSQVYSAGQKTYYYRLVGLDSLWQSNGSQNNVHFTNLSPGDYVFEVYCENVYGVRSPVLQVPFSIAKPFWLTWWFLICALFVVCLLIFLMIKYRERNLRKVQEKLEKTVVERTLEVREKMNEIEQQKEIIEDKNKELTDSIRYAKRIQNTLLAHEDLLKENLPEHFIFFRPKDIVSGDFYWAAKSEDYFFLAVCDSTGHGVPGAFMSLMNIRFLNEAIVEKEIHLPDEALNYVRNRLVQNLSSDGTKDGMDGTLIRFERGSNKILYASAHNSPLLIRNGLVQELPSDKIPIGLSEQMKSFNLQTIETQVGDVIYFFTDGYQDQFGGPKGKKLKHKNLVNLLLSLNQLPFDQQKEKLDFHLTEWKGDLEQLDDILVIGIRIN